MKTVGLSPKLYPALAAIVAGVILTLLVDRTVGGSILATGLALLGGGAALPPGDVVPTGTIGPASDELLPPEARARISGDAP